MQYTFLAQIILTMRLKQCLMLWDCRGVTILSRIRKKTETITTCWLAGLAVGLYYCIRYG